MKKESKKEKTVYAYIFWAHFFLAVTSKRIFKIVNVEDMGLKKKKKKAACIYFLSGNSQIRYRISILVGNQRELGFKKCFKWVQLNAGIFGLISTKKASENMFEYILHSDFT